jgi:N-acetyl-anhydromuramyl-L-alanine amidase AmpD
MKVSPRRLIAKLKAHKVDYKVVPGWDSAGIDPYNGRSDFKGVLLHHTAGTNSLNYIVNTNPYAPVRACHFLVQRDGLVQVVSGVGAYHAGKGGPYTFNRLTTIPKDQGNQHLYGIEIESLGTSANIDGKPQGMTVAQVVSTALLSAALLNAMRPTWRSLPVTRVIRHRDWTPRKIDVRQDLDWWHQVIGIARRNRKDRMKAEREIRAFIRKYPKGVIK